MADDRRSVDQQRMSSPGVWAGSEPGRRPVRPSRFFDALPTTWRGAGGYRRSLLFRRARSLSTASCGDGSAVP